MNPARHICQALSAASHGPIMKPNLTLHSVQGHYTKVELMPRALLWKHFSMMPLVDQINRYFCDPMRSVSATRSLASEIASKGYRRDANRTVNDLTPAKN